MRLELGFLLLLGASLAWKAANYDYRIEPDYERLSRDIAATLRQQGFSTRTITHIGRSPSIIAARGRCAMYVRAAEQLASLHGGYLRDSRAIGPLRYRIGETQYRAPPSFRMWYREFAQYTLGRFGMASDWDAPIAIAGSRGCAGVTPNLRRLRLNLFVRPTGAQ